MLGSPACASDGYIWAEPELRFVNELHGYVRSSTRRVPRFISTTDTLQ